jgi:dipeptidyl aminopeptidase/acylaminoacyl peptidase
VKAIGLTFGLGVLVALPGLAAEPPPVEAFFRNAEFAEVKLSPDGRFLAAIARVEAAPDARNLAVVAIDSKKATVLTGYEKEDIRSFEWVDDERLLFKLDRDYDSTSEMGEYLGTYAIQRDGSKGRVLHEPYAKDRRSMRGQPTGAAGGVRETVYLLDTLPGDSTHVLVEKHDARLIFPDVYRMDVTNGQMRKTVTNELNVQSWYADHSGAVRAGYDFGEERDDLAHRLVYRKSTDAPWQPVLDFRLGEVHVYGFDADDRHLWIAARIDRDTSALYKFDPESGALGDPVFADPGHDIHSAFSRMRGLVQDDDGTPLFLEYMAEKPQTRYFEQAWADRQATLDAAFPETFNAIVGWDRDHERFLVRAQSDRVRGDYYLYDDGKAKVSYLLSEARWLDARDLAEMRPVSFEARDGLTVHGYLTLPRDAGDGPVPLIVHPHGGPFGIRDEWGFDSEVQFLASRGYGVLQINYRGSGGYGERFETLGHKRWGLEMQDDLSDGVEWAIEQGIAEAERICIYGASYGGYATMVGLTRTPELYRCGINYVGVVDLAMLHRQWTTEYNVAGLRGSLGNWVAMALGDPRRDRERFHATSPINHIANIRAPLFVIHGRLDYNVDIEQYRALVGQLKKHGKPFETMTERYQGHGFFAESASIELHERIEAFLAENL